MTARLRAFSVGVIAALTALVATVAAPGIGPAATSDRGAAPTTATPTATAPTVTGPVTGGKGIPANAVSFDVTSVGYEQAEYFISGTATAYTSAQPLTADGIWTVTPGSTAPYKTRVLVIRPSDPKKFNGTVYVEWNNVSAGGEVTPDWALGHNEIVRAGAAWVGVSAQAVGVVGGGAGSLGSILQPLVVIDPDRYGTLAHPGDSYSYDMFSQSGAAVRARSGINPLGTLRAQRVIAIGESQSAFRLTTYIDAIQPLVHEFDGFLVHSRSSTGAPVSQAPLPVIAAPNPTFIRSDLSVPVIVVITETDLLTLGYRAARQADTKRLRVWEMAGTSHADAATLSGATDTGNGAGDVALFTAMASPPTSPVLGCAPAINAGDQTYVVRTALHDLDAWVRHGTAPPKGSRIDIDEATGAFVLDPHGNVTGGVRTPAVDAPIAKLSGIASSANSALCRLFGVTTPFDAATLAALYPTHAAFVKAWNKAVDAAVKAGFVLPSDAGHLEQAAAQSTIGAA